MKTTTDKQKILKGLKFLTPDLCTEYGGKRTSYIPAMAGWMKHPEPGTPDGESCGPGGWHIMLKCSAVYAPKNWWPWHSYLRGVLGQSNEKARGVEIHLRPIAPALWWRYLRRFGAGAYLRGADLRGAYLRGAYLRGADLRGADLTGANLTEADLTEAYLRGVDLYGADLRGADLRGADLRGADLTGANLTGADLTEADLYVSRLDGAIVNKFTIWPDGFNPPDSVIKISD
jgi:hypothetical protein